MDSFAWVTTERRDFPKILASSGLELIHFERGFVVVGLNVTGAPEPHLWVGDLFVHRPYRKRGVAKNIVDRLAVLAKDNGAHALYADAVVGAKFFKRTTEVLKRLGFRFHAADGKDLLVFRKQI